jgi:3-oxoacyl-[acyl-carrier protein] reductase
MLMLLEGKTAIITGVMGGIGKAVLELFAKNGADIIACYRIRNAEYEEYLQNLSYKNNINIITYHFDFSDETAVKEAGKAIVFGKRSDILVNCVGLAHGALFQMTPADDIRRIFEVNYFNQMIFTQSIVKIMTRQRSGSIVNIASASGIDGRTGNIAYGASKSALILATKTLSNEFAPYGIRVNALAPGIIETKMLVQMEEKARERLILSNAMRRPGKPEEVANAALFLASDMSNYITGQVIRVDGGL